MGILSSLVIIVIAGLIHATFQLSISVLTLLSGHAIGRKHSQHRLVLLTNAFTFGAATMTILSLCFIALLLTYAGDLITSSLLTWAIACGLLFGVGISVWIFYYRRGEAGTTLWVPRSVARYLNSRTKRTKHSAEAFGLGLTSVFAELLFIIAPLFIAALVLVGLSPAWQLAGISLYAVSSLGSLTLVNLLISSGHSLSRIQKWREHNKQFLQFSAGGGLLVLGFYVYVEHVMLANALAAAGGM